jgi:uncharacterized membrane protein YdjX (TVP38/TMEM64 family)
MIKLSSWNNQSVRFIVFVIVLVICFLVGRTFKVDLAACKDFLYSLPIFLSGIIFVILYVGLTCLIWFGPKDFLRVSSALIYGPYWSTVFVCVGEMLNLVVMFHLSRRLGRDYVQSKFNIKPADLDKVKEKGSIWGILALRINMLFSYRVLDLAYGLTQVEFKKYFWTSFFAAPLRIFVVQAVLSAIDLSKLKDPSGMFQYFTDFLLSRQDILILCMSYVVIVMVISIVAVILKLVRIIKTRKELRIE